jgi:hypothetical protein
MKGLPSAPDSIRCRNDNEGLAFSAGLDPVPQ